MNKETDNTDQSLLKLQNGKEIHFPAFSLYPPGEDIYKKSRQEEDIDPEDISKLKTADENDQPGRDNEKGFEEDVSGGDLDVPGSELDDDQENIGSEDEENNNYSLGGDNHNDLDEDRGE